ncbi:hypothetical protein NIES2101_23155 [Calothrix sp. HK-06]|nr:hypothetical protein NIES2101_23155 [Calothrix sp. HK-06]
MTNLLSTKFYIPSIRSPLVQRARLIEKLNYGMGCKLTLISAPAGFGKTTLLSEWLRQTKKPVYWLSLDEGDNDLKPFFTYFIAALQFESKKIGSSILSMLNEIEFTNYESFLIPLINEIAKLKQDITLVLDDYHLITNCLIHSSLTFLLEHLPPQLHLAIASRVEPPLPVARLRARNQLTEIRGADLRFSNTEAALFFNQVMKLSLTKEQIEEIQTPTEGWIAGLQLAALSIQDAPDISKFIESFKGSQRHILDYLVEEVLEQQTQPIQSFLLKTSILEQMCGALVEEVLGSESQLDGTSILEYLENRNLFIVPLDNDAGGRKARVMEVLILQALVWQARSNIKQALSALNAAMNIPQQGEYIRIFVDEGQPMMELLRHAASRGINPKYISRLLAVFGIAQEEASIIVEPLIEPLSERELEVLHYLETGLSNQVIAEKLFVSLAAIKWHARNIYSKLNVSNRTQAVHRARELEILK